MCLPKRMKKIRVGTNVVVLLSTSLVSTSKVEFLWCLLQSCCCSNRCWYILLRTRSTVAGSTYEEVSSTVTAVLKFAEVLSRKTFVEKEQYLLITFCQSSASCLWISAALRWSVYLFDTKRNEDNSGYSYRTSSIHRVRLWSVGFPKGFTCQQCGWDVTATNDNFFSSRYEAHVRHVQRSTSFVVKNIG